MKIRFWFPGSLDCLRFWEGGSFKRVVCRVSTWSDFWLKTAGDEVMIIGH